MSDGEVARLVFLRDSTPRSQVDAALRDTLVPAMAAVPGVVDVYAARRGPDQDGERVIASIWSSADALQSVIGGGELTVERANLSPTVAFGAEEMLPLAFALRFPSKDPARVLRIYRGEVREGLISAYIDAARNGAIADGSNGAGPLAIFLGTAGGRRFVTVSAWADWSTLLHRTGGSIDQPIATQHSEMLVDGSATHFEILPDAAPMVKAESLVHGGNARRGR